ncbi:vesicular, overexpressed in cancer, prosurvival protein 1 isoform X2 [Suricata suricatta]|uniref:vesicular, overexpressed in cancer, prosurvival protein 1 isoform X2 n=1 Tax=Suricata suricatta TaxID=37032 RepID=UPI00115546E3|nr:vesicular, overexpressed in cancer, prosurvival protein 1 isoform X2 [Suricata suricatta]XP_029782279.1 vesicular, overexpressed in cancer, prosurvival protein 1 isoform X2 [Suricata suricatta]
MSRQPRRAAALLLGLLVECTEAKKHCWYFEGLYPTYYICRPYEDCCGSRCCVRALSIQRLWYFWFLLMMGVLFCCGAGFFIRRRMYPPPLIEEPAFNVSYTRQPPNTTPGAGWSVLKQHPGAAEEYPREETARFVGPQDASQIMCSWPETWKPSSDGLLL